jgi:hypothetical protein
LVNISDVFDNCVGFPPKQEDSLVASNETPLTGERCYSIFLSAIEMSWKRN